MCNKQNKLLIIVGFIFLFISASIGAAVYAQEPAPSQTPSAPPSADEEFIRARGTTGVTPSGQVPAAQSPTIQSPGAPSVSTDYTLAEPLPVPGNAPITRTNFIAYLQWLFPFMLSLAGILAVVMIIIGGFQYMTSAGSTDSIGRAKDRITNAILGLLLAAASWVILNTINPDLVRFRLDIATLRLPSTNTPTSRGPNDYIPPNATPEQSFQCLSIADCRALTSDRRARAGTCPTTPQGNACQDRRRFNINLVCCYDLR